MTVSRCRSNRKESGSAGTRSIGNRKSQPIRNYHSLTSNEIENQPTSLELTLNSGSVDPFTGRVVVTTMTLAQLWAHYQQKEVGNLRARTARCYKTVWRLYIEPRWGAMRIAEVKTIEVEEWLREVKLQNGELASKE